MISLISELYKEMNKIIGILKSSGNAGFSEKLSDALSISTIPSEVLGESRLALIELSKTDLPEKLNIKNEVDESLKYLNDILR